MTILYLLKNTLATPPKSETSIWPTQDPVAHMSLPLVISLLGLLWLVYQFGRFLLCLISVRSKFQRMQKDGLVSHGTILHLRCGRLKAPSLCLPIILCLDTSCLLPESCLSSLAMFMATFYHAKFPKLILTWARCSIWILGLLARRYSPLPLPTAPTRSQSLTPCPNIP